MKKVKLLVALASLMAAVFGLSLTALAAPNPSGTGQPGASCGAANALVEPNGFSTSGFAQAGTVYAGSAGSASLVHSNSSKAVSQYDVACYQLSNKHSN
jgi:hypothetical protein